MLYMCPIFLLSKMVDPKWIPKAANQSSPVPLSSSFTTCLRSAGMQGRRTPDARRVSEDPQKPFKRRESTPRPECVGLASTSKPLGFHCEFRLPTGIEREESLASFQWEKPLQRQKKSVKKKKTGKTICPVCVPVKKTTFGEKKKRHEGGAFTCNSSLMTNSWTTQRLRNARLAMFGKCHDDDC